MRVPLRTVLLICGLMVVGCDMVETDQPGSWEHFNNGGMFNSGIPSGSSDGSVYFVSSATGKGDIYRWDQQADTLQRMTASADFEGNPLVCLDNEYLYFTRERTGKSTIVALEVGTHRELQVTEGTTIDSPVAEIAGGKAPLFSLRHTQFRRTRSSGAVHGDRRQRQ